MVAVGSYGGSLVVVTGSYFSYGGSHMVVMLQMFRLIYLVLSIFVDPKHPQNSSYPLMKSGTLSAACP